MYRRIKTHIALPAREHNAPKPCTPYCSEARDIDDRYDQRDGRSTDGAFRDVAQVGVMEGVSEERVDEQGRHGHTDDTTMAVSAAV